MILGQGCAAQGSAVRILNALDRHPETPVNDHPEHIV